MSLTSLSWLIDNRLVGLIVKEAIQTIRNKHLLFLLIFPPTLQLLILGAALDPGVHNVSLAVVDYSQSAVSRELVSSISAGGLFRSQELLPAENALEDTIRFGKATAGLVIPPDFEKDLSMRHRADVQVVVDGTDTYTAGIAGSYLRLMLLHFDPAAQKSNPAVSAYMTALYNPGLKSSWYFVPGVLGGLLTLIATLVSSAALLREKEVGTLEQLLMTPYSVGEILVAKTVPIFLLLMCDVFLSIAVSLAVFGLPFRGSLWLFTLSSALYICVGIGFGMLLATICRSQRQAQLASFFINIPLIQLSGAVVPFETMPDCLKAISSFDPLRYYVVILRGLLLKGAGLDVLWPNLICLALAAGLLLLISLSTFRRQLN